jgi:hypothetical protein
MGRIEDHTVLLTDLVGKGRVLLQLQRQIGLVVPVTAYEYQMIYVSNYVSPLNPTPRSPSRAERRSRIASERAPGPHQQFSRL